MRGGLGEKLITNNIIDKRLTFFTFTLYTRYLHKAIYLDTNGTGNTHLINDQLVYMSIGKEKNELRAVTKMWSHASIEENSNIFEARSMSDQRAKRLVCII